MIDLIEVEKERLLDEVSFLWVLFYFVSVDGEYPLPPSLVVWEQPLTDVENLGLPVPAKWK